jgi:hypothetical protein
VRSLRVFTGVLTCALALAPFGAVHAADMPAPALNAACVSPFYVTGVDGDPNVVVVRAIDLPGPFTGTITAYGADTMSTAKIERAAVIDLPYGGQEASLTVRADRPIEGVAYAPAWASCAFRAGTRPSRYYAARELQRPTLMVGDAQPVEATSCRQTYAPATVKQAVEPFQPATREVGLVRVAVALDDHGKVLYARVVDSPAINLNPPSIDAARRSEYAPAIFRCKPVSSSYQFVVDYVG